MFRGHRARSLAVVVAVAAAAVGAQALAAGEKQLTGHLRSQVLAEGCTSPIGLCTAGRLNGGISGDFVFTGHSLQPSSTAGVFFYTGEIVVQAKGGELRCTDAGAYDFNPGSDGAVVDLCTITGGTGAYADASGWIEIYGVFTLDGGGTSDYRARLDTG